MTKINKIDLLSFAKFLALIGALIGLVFGVIYSFGGLIADSLVSLGWVTTPETSGLSYGTVLAFGALIGMPLIGAAFGFICGLVGSILYNGFAKKFGGIELKFN